MQPVFYGDAPTLILGQNINTTALLPLVKGGDGTISYSVSPSVPSPLTFTTGTQTILIVFGTPPTILAASSHTMTATDGDGDSDTIDFTLAVAEPHVIVTPTKLYVDEKGGTGTYTVALDSSVAGVTVTIANDNPTPPMPPFRRPP